MKILLVRHGETDYNNKRLVQGHTNIPLNKTGIKQAKEAAQKILDYKIDAAYSSTMDRAYDTCRYMLDFSKNEKINITKDTRILEKNYGKFEGSTYEQWHKGQEDNDIDTVELDRDIVRRVEEFLLEKYEAHKNQTILVVCHGACIRIFLESKDLRPNKDFIVNTALNELEYDGKNFSLLKYNA